MKKNILAVILLIASAFTGTLAFRLAVPAIAYYSRDVLKASMVSISVISTSFIFARAFAAVLGGYVVDKRPRLIFLGALAMALNAPLVYLYSLATSWMEIVGIKLANGFLNGISWPLAQLAVAYASPKNIRARISAIYFFAGSLASLTGNYLYAFTSNLGIKGQMVISGLFYVSTGFLMLFAYLLIGSVKKVSGDKKSELEIDPKIILGLGALFSFLSAFAFGEVTYVYISESLDMSKEKTAVLLGTVSFLSSLTSYLLSWIADSMGTTQALRLISVLAGLSPFFASIKVLPTIIIGIFLALVSVNSFRPISRKVLVSHSRSSLAIGGINGIQNISTFIGGIIFGLAYSLGSFSILHLAFLPYYPLAILSLIMVKEIRKFTKITSGGER
ncbi:putative Permease, major facilitator superfamily [Pyrococcus sp. ST04]|nr:putative Permease, major facilitator superfamily [Pyrococcus sp. ST04]